MFKYVSPLVAVALASGCALFSETKPKTGAAASTGTVFALPEADSAGVSTAKDQIKDFKELNSSDNFTMPIGNNFTMPIGNNFTMPIGNNLIGNVGGAYRIADVTLGKDVLFGFVPIPKGAKITATSKGAGLPAAGATQSAAISQGMTGTLELTRDDSLGSEGYSNKITYTSATANVGGSSKTIDAGSFYTLKMSGATWSINQDKKDAFDGAFILDQNASPATLNRRVETFEIKSSGTTVASIKVDQQNYEKLSLSLPKVGSKESQSISIQLPKNVAVSGYLTKSTSSSMGINLKALADTKSFTLFGWLKQCGTPTCTASDPATNSAPGEIREELSLDVETAQSKLVFKKDPTDSDTYGWILTLHFDYAAAIVAKGVGGSALTGDLWLIEKSGNKAAGGKLADIASDASGNVLIKYLDGTTDTWKLGG